MICLNTINAVAVNAATGTATQQVAAIVEEKLCRPVCKNQEIQPTATVAYSLENQYQSGTSTFVELVAQGSINFVPKGGCACNVMTKMFTERTTLIFSNPSATNQVPAITLTQGASDGTLTDADCNTAKSYQIATLVQVSAVWS